MLADIHCHLDELTELDLKLNKAVADNITYFFSNSVDLGSMKKNLALAEEYSEIKPCLGVHPNNVSLMNSEDLNLAFEFMKENISRAFGIGETGLDFSRADNTQKIMQIDFFRKSIDLAVENNLPLMVHSRQARKECIDLLEQGNAKKVLMHWFISKNLLNRVLENDWFVGVGPSVLFNDSLSGFVKKIPISNMLLETDCPVKFNGNPSEPVWIRKIGAKVCEIKGIEFEDAEFQFYDNMNRLFGKKKGL